MKVGIIGCGLIGKKRAMSLSPKDLIAVADIDLIKADLFKEINPDIKVFNEWDKILSLKEIELIIIATTNNLLSEITYEAVKANKHVIVEKPAAKNFMELERVLSALKDSKSKVKVGFNHRYHPGLKKAYEIFKSGVLGELMFIRGRYGHGGRVGYEKEWRANPLISGGGELIDQGVHLIDLSRWFLGKFKNIYGLAKNYYWDMPVEDNCFMSLETQDGKIAWLQVSCTEWKNMFSFEIYGKYGKLQIDGLGGSYGIERLSYYKMLPEMGPPGTTIWEFPGEDRSWKDEYNDFIKSIQENSKINGDLRDAYEALKIINYIYKRNEK